MATNAIKYEIKALLLLSLALFSYSESALIHDHESGYGGRRGLVAAAGGATVFNVNSYGAKADGKTDNVQAFMKAWNAACKSTGPVKLVIPAGTYMAGQVRFNGPCTATSPIIVEVQGTIIAQTDISEYPSAEWFEFSSINGLILTGGGTFNGQGEKSWQYNNCRGKSFCQLLPTSIKFSKVSNSVIHSISSINSKSFHMLINSCNNITVYNLKITAPGDSPNTDGIHISRSSLVNVSSTVIGTGDDCISIGAGTTNLSLTGITCGPGHGISVGSLGKYKNEADVRGIVVRNCKLFNTTNGLRIKTWPGSPPSAASGIFFEDIIMDNVKNPIIIDQHYGSKNSAPSRVKISDVHYKNIRGTSTTDVAVNFQCSEQFPCDGVQLADINLSFNGAITKKTLPFSSSCLNAKVVFGGKLNPPPCP